MNKLKNRKLYRSSDDKIIAGIFGGLGEYLDVDPNLLRVIVLFFLVLTFFSLTVPFLVAYFIAVFIIPSERDLVESRKNSQSQ